MSAEGSVAIIKEVIILVGAISAAIVAVIQAKKYTRSKQAFEDLQEIKERTPPPG